MAGWKNFLKDLGSAVVPAAMTIGATALTGGAALAPMTLLAAGGAGAKGFARNEEEERRRKQMKRQAEENRRAQGAANLINSLQPGTGARARPSEIAAPKAGFGEILAGGAATGIQAYTMAKQAQDALKQRELERKRLGLQIDEAEEARQIREGRQRASEELLQRDQGEAGLRERITEQGEQLTGRPPLQLQTEADAMRVLEKSPESFSPRLSTLQSIGGAQATSAGKELEELWSGPKGSGPGFGSPPLEAAPAPTGPAAVGYYQAMAADEERRFKASLDVEAQDIRQRQLEYNKKSLEDRTAYQRMGLEADQAALKATRDFKAGEGRDKHRIDTENYVQGLTSVERLGEFRRNYQSVQDMLDTIAAGQAEAKRTRTEYKISGTTQIGLLNLFHNMIDPATVREGDIDLYRKQAQGLFDRVFVEVGVIAKNQAGVVSPELLDGMNGTLAILKGGYEQAAADQMGAFFNGRIRMGLEMIPAELTTGLRAASFTAYELGDPVEMREALRSEIAMWQQQYPGDAPAQPLYPLFAGTVFDSGGNAPPANTVSDSGEGVSSFVSANGPQLTAPTDPPQGVTTPATFNYGQNVQPSVRLDSLGRADSPWEGTPRGGLSTAQQTDFSRMSDAEKKKRIAEYTRQGGRFMADHVLSGKYSAPRMLANALGL